MSLWQFAAAVGGVIKSRTPEGAQTLNAEQAGALVNLLDDAPFTWH